MKLSSYVGASLMRREEVIIACLGAEAVWLIADLLHEFPGFLDKSKRAPGFEKDFVEYMYEVMNLEGSLKGLNLEYDQDRELVELTYDEECSA